MKNDMTEEFVSWEKTLADKVERIEAQRDRYHRALRIILRDTHEANVAHTIAREALKEPKCE